MLILTGVIIGAVATAGIVVTTFVNLVDFATLLPHPDTYATLILSRRPAAVLFLYLTKITLEFTFPESITAFVVSPSNGFPDKLPTNDHSQPVTDETVTALVVGNAGAV